MTVRLSKQDQRLVHGLQTLGDATRYKMFKLMLADSKFCVSEIAEQLGVSSSAVSQHFRTFEILGLVKKERLGQRVCYSLNQNDELSKKLIQLTK